MVLIGVSSANYVLLNNAYNAYSAIPVVQGLGYGYGYGQSYYPIDLGVNLLSIAPQYDYNYLIDILKKKK